MQNSLQNLIVKNENSLKYSNNYSDQFKGWSDDRKREIDRLHKSFMETTDPVKKETLNNQIDNIIKKESKKPKVDKSSSTKSNGKC